ncbi:MAG: hypothetical protein JNJ78_21745 [Anaerolineae bacterium]|nr:hypothetical protein [Anaerolineae bacterium]
MDVTAATRGHDGERVPMWSLVSRYMVVKLRGVTPPPALRAASPKALGEAKTGRNPRTSVAQMSEVRVTKWSLFGDEFSNDLRERDC